MTVVIVVMFVAMVLTIVGNVDKWATAARISPFG
jgi:hypothetical protein